MAMVDLFDARRNFFIASMTSFSTVQGDIDATGAAMLYEDICKGKQSIYSAKVHQRTTFLLDLIK